jgi:glycosyltransferase involved in cell wall biosynthesis
MRVLHIFGTMNRGGAELRTISLMPDMGARDVVFDYCVLSGEKGVMDETIEQYGGSLHYCKLDVAFVFTFIALLRKHNYDAVHSHVAYVSGFILLLARIARVKRRICHFRNTSDGGDASLLRKLRNKLLRLSIKLNATHILGVCAGALIGFMGNRWAENPKCQVIYNGFAAIDSDPKDDFWRHKISDYQQQKVIVNVARMDHQKNHLRQAHIFHQITLIHPDVHMVWIGKEEENCKNTMLAFLNDKGITHQTTFMGLQADVMPLVDNADVMLFPSLWEGLPGGVIEAASVGLAVVASDLPGVIEIAQQLPVVNVLPLTASDQQWAERVVLSFSDTSAKAQAVIQFKSSEFQLINNVNQLHAIYTA